jgi:phosphinothricin acetyltransferase
VSGAPSALTLRPAAATDVPAVSAITRAGYSYLVAEIDGAVAGYAYASAFRSRPAYRFMAENSVYIAPESQGRGIGRALMERLIADLEGLGFRRIIAVIGGALRRPASSKALATSSAAGSTPN